MERRVKFIYGLTICVIIAYSIVQGYWMYSRYQLSLEEYESELYATITACVEEDISMRKALPASLEQDRIHAFMMVRIFWKKQCL